ncbi:dihydroxyacetone kinase phosphoryl donor subunit DhaM [Garciella nitratireducens]|uniref:phosphoenolpyruvate--glycerone phosphotransferase n=1 Tax=Garciella nitratireducens DSM 15102 TaxID=1121911 RepID=A0A1T4KZ45_9FIRM|nr:dihydroxyacetone kinase phosphoryl donor subunit DhaM [Garciella nitratireducens]SJZ47735.1 dihydroxyacetone kinase, phosphotransfer subunit [Garciella nitratireducens DSM 15102]
MIGLVIVSHSNKISNGIVDLCYQMAGKNIKIISAGGTSDGRIGTDPIFIKEAIEKANDGDGVVIFADIGSSIMSSELAIEMLEKDLQEKTYILDTPIVEGAVAVAVQACMSNDIQEILNVAEEARQTRKIS